MALAMAGLLPLYLTILRFAHARCKVRRCWVKPFLARSDDDGAAQFPPFTDRKTKEGVDLQLARWINDISIYEVYLEAAPQLLLQGYTAFLLHGGISHLPLLETVSILASAGCILRHMLGMEFRDFPLRVQRYALMLQWRSSGYAEAPVVPMKPSMRCSPLFLCYRIPTASFSILHIIFSVVVLAVIVREHLFWIWPTLVVVCSSASFSALYCAWRCCSHQPRRASSMALAGLCCSSPPSCASMRYMPIHRSKLPAFIFMTSGPIFAGGYGFLPAPGPEARALLQVADGLTSDGRARPPRASAKPHTNCDVIQGALFRTTLSTAMFRIIFSVALIGLFWFYAQPGAFDMAHRSRLTQDFAIVRPVVMSGLIAVILISLLDTLELCCTRACFRGFTTPFYSCGASSFTLSEVLPPAPPPSNLDEGIEIINPALGLHDDEEEGEGEGEGR